MNFSVQNKILRCDQNDKACIFGNNKSYARDMEAIV